MTDDHSETTGSKQRQRHRGQFKPGVSGNPAGRPKGARHRATLAAEALLDGEAETLTRKAVELALDGDVTALRLCLERILPPRKDGPVRLDLPTLETATDLVRASTAILQAVANGDVTPIEAQAIAALLQGHGRAIELNDLTDRVERLEEERSK